MGGARDEDQEDEEEEEEEEEEEQQEEQGGRRAVATALPCGDVPRGYVELLAAQHASGQLLEV